MTKIPYSQNAEEALLGSVIIDPSCAHLLDLSPSDFYIQRHSWIWASVRSLQESGINPDFVTLSEDLEKKGKLAELGGPAYLSSLVSNSHTSSFNVENYANIIKDRAARRRMLEIANRMAKAAYDEEQDVSDVSIQSAQMLSSVTRPVGGARHISEYISALYDDVENRVNNPKDVYGMQTGLADFDRITGGLQKSESVYIAGRSGLGKSILAVQMGVGMASAGHPGVIYSLEMDGLVVTRRMISALAEVETRKLKTGYLEDGDWHKFTSAIESAEQLPIFLSDESYWTTAGIRSDLARLKMTYGIEWFVLDYLYLMSDGMGTMSIVDRTEMLSSRIKLMCKEFCLSGVTINSVTKEGDVRGSEQVKHDADIVCMLMEHKADNTTNYVELGNMRTLQFKKGRELESSNIYMHLVKHDLYPWFYCFEPEPNAQRV